MIYVPFLHLPVCCMSYARGWACYHESIHCIGGWCHVLNSWIGDMLLLYHDLLFDGDVMLLCVSTWKEISIALEVATSGVVASGVATFGFVASGVVAT
jgi:hypothetical protein